MRARLAMVGILALAFAPAAFGAHSMTSPSDAGIYVSKSSTGFVKFDYVDVENRRHLDNVTVSDFRFHNACTKTLTHVNHTIHVIRGGKERANKKYRFSYQTDDARIAGTMVFNRNSNFPRFSGSITLADPDDCAATPGGEIVFRASL